MRKSSIESKDRHNRRSRAQVSRIDGGHSNQPTASRSPHHQQAHQLSPMRAITPPPIKTNFRFIINKPSAIVIDLLGVLVCKSFMTSSKEFKEFLQRNLLEYLNECWKQKQLKIMINFFRCSQQVVPEDYKLADREETREEQIKQAKRHVLWRLRNDSTSSALSLFMLGITEWGYKNKTLVTRVYDDVLGTLKLWKDMNVPTYVGVGSADFLVMVLTNTNHGNLLQYFSGHMNIMDFDGTRANKDFKRLSAILKLPAERILYLTRFRQDCRKAIENGLQSLIVLRQDFDSHGLITQLKAKRGNATSTDGTKMNRAPFNEDANSPPVRGVGRVNDPEIKEHLDRNISSLSLIEDHEENDRFNQSSQIVEQDLNRYNIVLSLAEITFKNHS